MFSQQNRYRKITTETLESEKSPKIQWENLKEQSLLVKKVNLLERSKQVLCNNIKVEQKMIHKRFEDKIYQSRITYAKLIGSRDLQRELRKKKHHNLNTDICRDEETDEMLQNIWDQTDERAELLDNMMIRRRGLSIGRSRSAGATDSKRCWTMHRSSCDRVLPVTEFHPLNDSPQRPATATPMHSSYPRVEVASPCSPDYDAKDSVLNISGPTAKTIEPKKLIKRSSLRSNTTSTSSSKPRVSISDDASVNSEIDPITIVSENTTLSVQEQLRDCNSPRRWTLTTDTDIPSPMSTPRHSVFSNSSKQSVTFAPRRTSTDNFPQKNVPLTFKTALRDGGCGPTSLSQSSIGSTVVAKSRMSRYVRKKSSKVNIGTADCKPKLVDFHKTRVQSANYEHKVKQFSNRVDCLRAEQDNVVDYYSQRAKENGLKERQPEVPSAARRYAESMLEHWGSETGGDVVLYKSAPQRSVTFT